MDSEETKRIESYLRNVFNNVALNLQNNRNKKDSAELYIKDEFIGVVYKDEDGDYNFSMPILAMDID